MNARYTRQLPLLGPHGQEALARAKVFVAGVGGLGSAAAFYLAAAGVGTLRLCDHDRVSRSNLNRQILHTTEDLDRPKVDSAVHALTALNPEIRIEPRQEKMDESTLPDLLQDMDLIVDATDNYPTRRLLNRAALASKLPLIFGGVDSLDGMAAVFLPRQGPCFECIFPEPASPKDQIPVLGTSPGIIGSIQALEAVKLITGVGWPLTHRLLRFTGAEAAFRTTQLSANPDCPACSPLKPETQEVK